VYRARTPGRDGKSGIVRRDAPAGQGADKAEEKVRVGE
jgi:hypothetical protein